MNFEVIGKDVFTFNLEDYLDDNSYMLRMRNNRFEEIRQIVLFR